MKKVLLVIDRPDWAFDTIAKAIIAANDRPFEMETFHLKGHDRELKFAADRADLLFFFTWSLAGLPHQRWWARGKETPFAKQQIKPRFSWLDPSRAVMGLHSIHDFTDQPIGPESVVPAPANLINFLKKFRAVHGVSHRVIDRFRRGGLQKICLLENGVDAGQFRPTTVPGVRRRLVVGASGTKKRDWVYGISEYIEPLGGLDFVDLRLAIPEEGKYVPHERMPQFLNDCDVYVLASASEGFPLKVLEACACGRPVVTTKVGGCEDLIQDGVNGFFVERTVDAFVEKLELLHKNRNLLISLGRASRDIIEGNWTWKHKAPAWLDFIEANL